MDQLQNGFLLGLALAASAGALLCAAFAGLALVKVFAFERSTHSVQFEPMPLPASFPGKNAKKTDKDLTDVIDQTEDDLLDGLDDVHHESSPLM